MTDVKIGAIVRLYSDLSDCFDEGLVIAVKDNTAIVEFYDWQQSWPIADLQYSIASGSGYFKARSHGAVIQRFAVGRTPL